MLVQFKVKGFKNFKKELIFDLNVSKSYDYNTKAICNDLVKVATIYGDNGSGKSNLGMALLDIVTNLTDKRITYNSSPYQNLLTKDNIQFSYTFEFNSIILQYTYEKQHSHLIQEEVIINNKRVIYYNHPKQIGEVHLKGAETLNTDLKGTYISFVKYVRNNTNLIMDEFNTTFLQFISFVNNMEFIDMSQDTTNETLYNTIAKCIIDNNKLKDFQDFLNKFNIHYTLVAQELGAFSNIYCSFNNKLVNFFKIASNGECKLAYLYSKLISLDTLSLIYIDDITICFHNNVAIKILKEIIDNSGHQVIVTAHNTSLLNSDLLRPDCMFNIVQGKIKSFPNSTAKEIRRNHNIEKMYNTGVFDY